MSAHRSQASHAIREIINTYALKAHLVLESIKTSPMTVEQFAELSCYIETAWQGGNRFFKQPPGKLQKAKDIMVPYRITLDGSGGDTEVSAADWETLCSGVLCADGVWERLSGQDLLVIADILNKQLL